jgi:hypothetical protein
VMPSSRRVASYAARPGTWRHLARRAGWHVGSVEEGTPRPVTWPIDADVSERLVLRWPNRYSSPNASGWVEPIKAGIGRHVVVESADILQLPGNVVLLEAVVGSDRLRVALDYEDRCDLHEVASEVDLYFKLQYQRGGYDIASVRPGGYVTKQAMLYQYADRWRSLRERSLPSYDVLGRFGMRWAQAIRAQAIEQLSVQSQFRFEGGSYVRWWGEYMDEICRARVCLDLPGRGEFCYRLVEYLAVGACVIGPELKTELHVPLESGVHLVRVPRSLEGLVAECERLLSDDGLRYEIQLHAQDYFDHYLRLEQLGAYYVHTCWSAITS